MEIMWVGHACFHIQGKRATLLTDPFPGSPGHLSPDALGATVVAFSSPRDRSDTSRAGLPDSARILQGPGEYEIRGFYIRGVRTALPSPEPQRPGNTAYSIAVDGVTLCHLGRLGDPLTSRQVQELATADLLFVPVGGEGALSASQAAEVVGAIGPKVVIPMYYDLPRPATGQELLDTFLREMGLKKPEPQPRLSLTRSALPAETTVTVLQPQRV